MAKKLCGVEVRRTTDREIAELFADPQRRESAEGYPGTEASPVGSCSTGKANRRSGSVSSMDSLGNERLRFHELDVDLREFEFIENLRSGDPSREVMKLRHRRTGGLIVVKWILIWRSSSSIFHREVEMLRNFQHVPQVVRFLGVSFSSERPDAVALVTEWAEGGSLDSALRSGGLTGAQMSSILLDILQGLKALHEADVIHQDIKPSNILLNAAKDRACLCDFGSSRLSDEGATQTAMITQGYAAEEAVRGEAVKASDVFSFGVLLREVVAGRRPNVADPAYLAVRDKRFDLTGIANAGVVRIISDCVQQDPARRPDLDCLIASLTAIGDALLNVGPLSVREIRFREEGGSEIFQFMAKESETVGQALETENLDGRLYDGERAIPMGKRIRGLDPDTIYVLRGAG